jgi:hypothetical protein
MVESTSSNVEVTTVPNGTTVLSAETVKYIDKYRSFARQTAESIINLGLTLIEAESKLNPVDFKIFCDEISVPKNGSVYKKLRVIGGSAARLLVYADRLPNTWTTIYQIANINADLFEHVVESLSPFITAKELNALIGKEEKSKNKSSGDGAADFEISLGHLDIETKASIFEKIYQMKNLYNFSVKSARQLEDDIANLKKAAKAA